MIQSAVIAGETAQVGPDDFEHSPKEDDLRMAPKEMTFDLRHDPIRASI